MSLRVVTFCNLCTQLQCRTVTLAYATIFVQKIRFSVVFPLNFTTRQIYFLLNNTAKLLDYKSSRAVDLGYHRHCANDLVKDH